MKPIDYSAILTQRSLLPRREHLYQAIRSKESALRELREKFQEEETRLLQELSDLNLARSSYSYSQTELELISRAYTVVDREKVEGVYQILHKGIPCYIGEAQCVRSRLKNHAAAILRCSQSHDIYPILSSYNLEDIDFCLIESTAKPHTYKGTSKNWRLVREAHHAYQAIDDGFELLNKSFIYSREDVARILSAANSRLPG